MQIPDNSDDPALFPIENPNPVFRAAADGVVSFANRAGGGLLTSWGTGCGRPLPDEWRKRIADALASGEGQRVVAPAGDRMFELDLVPIPTRGCVNIYGRDVTEQEAARREREVALASLQESVQALSQSEAALCSAYEAIARNEAKYRLLFDSIDEGFCIIEVLFDENERAIDYRFLEANPAFERQTGLVNAMGRRVRDMVPLHEAHWFEVYGRIALTGVPERFENAAGQLGRYYDVYAFRVGEPAERKVAVLFNDVNERKRIEVRLRRSEEQARDLIRYAPSGIYEVDIRTGRFRSVNDAMCKILGYSREELLAMPAFDLLDGEGKVRFAGRMRRTLAGEKVDPSVEYRVIRKDGSAIDALLSIRITAHDGQPDAAFVIAHDITERRRAAEELRLAAETLERRVQERTAELERANAALSQREASLRYQAAVLENVNDAIVAYNVADLRVTTWNRRAEEQYGWAAEEALGAYAPTVVGSQLDPKIRAEIVETVAKEGQWRGELPHTRRDGTPIVVETTSTVLRDDSGRVVAHVTANRDITDRKRLEDELRASREQLRNLSHRLVERQESERTSVAHELYNDKGQRLAALLLELGFLEREAGGNQPLLDRIRRMRTSIDGILFDMHNLAVDLRPASLDRLGLMAGLRHHADKLGQQHGRDIQIEMSGPKAVSLPADVEGMVYRIAQEALANAIRHTQAGQIGIIAAQRKDCLVLVIEDDGQGFDVDEAVRRGGVGIVGMRERTEMLGGRLTIESKPGMGTAVYIEVPVHQP